MSDDEVTMTYFGKPQLIEADGLYTSIVEFPRGEASKYAIVLENRSKPLKMYFFMNGDQIADLCATLLDQLDPRSKA